MTDTKKEIDKLKKELAELKITIRKIESFLLNIPNPEDSIHQDNFSDDLIEKAKKVVAQYDRASASLLQRRLSIGYSRAARLLDKLEEKGIVGQAEGVKPRIVFLNG